MAEVIDQEIKSYLGEQPKRKRKIKTVFLASSPLETPQKEMAKEIRNIVDLVRESELRKNLDFVTWWIYRYQGMVELICLEEPEIIHFMGSDNNEFCLKDDQGKVKAVSGEQIRDLFGFLRGKVALVVIGPGFSDTQRALICSEMQFTVTSQLKGDDATRFSAVLYREMAEGKSIREAYDQAALTAGAGLTQLYHRPEVNPADVKLGVDRDLSPSDKTVRFVQIEMATDLCMWREMRHNCSPEAPPVSSN